ncbi:MAG: hypothetical protein PHC75_09615 [Burkholderiales bacterium]|nr:hypothetical protein [Burkholderiales bacterium]
MDGWVKIGTELDTKSFDAQIKEVELQLEEIENKLKKADMGFEVGDTMKLESQYEKLSQKLSTLRTKQADLNRQDFSKVEQSLEKVGSKVETVIRKIGKWALAVFGIRSAYMAVRRAVSMVSRYNEQIKTDLDYMGFALSSILEPIIQWLIKGVFTLLQYVNYIAMAWFGVNLFAKASAKSFAGANKQAKELKKTLAGFDEVNILNDDGSTGVLGGAVAPSVDLSEMDIEVPKWLEWIGNNKDKILQFFIELGVVIGALKLATFFRTFDLGLGIFIGGVVLMIANIIDLIDNWENLDTKSKLIKVALAVLGGALIALGYAIATGFSVATLGVGALIAGLIAITTVVVAKLANQEKSILSVVDAQENLKKSQEDLATATDTYIDAVDRAEESLKKLEEAEKNNKISGEELFKEVENGTLDYKDMNDAQKEVYKAYLDNDTAQKDLKKSTDDLTTAKKNEMIASYNTQLAIAKETGNYDDFKKKVVDAFKKGELTAGEARDYIERAMGSMGTSARNTFGSDIPNEIANGLNPTRYESLGTRLRNWFSNLWSGIKSFFGKVNIQANVSGGGGAFATGGLVVPRLASGGLINYPNRGVPLGQAIGGESGTEGVIPLTDSQAMETLGQAIGRYIRIDNLIDVNMDSRRINRLLAQSKARENFALNG